MVVRGSSGSGKTTLLNIIDHIEAADWGKYRPVNTSPVYSPPWSVWKVKPRR